MRANYYGWPSNSSWLTHVATFVVTNAPEHQVPEGEWLVFAQVGCDTSPVRRALLLIAWLHGIAEAGPEASKPSPPDQDGAPRASASPSPWIDLAPTAILENHATDATPPDHRVRGALELAGFYAGFSTWAYFAWYRSHPPLSKFKFGGDGMFGVRTYAGGADKMGHAWATMALARLGTAMLDGGGYDHTKSTLLSAGLSEFLFLNVEIHDGFYFEFSYGDLAMDTVGMFAAIALELWPRLDELIDYRVQYFPSARYIDNVDGSPNFDGTPSCPKGGCSKWNIAEDYSGQTYLLALHLSGIHTLRDMPHGAWTRFVDVAVGFESRNYKPPPDPARDHRSDPSATFDPHQDLFVGVSLNAQGMFDYLFEGGHHESLRKVTHGLFEVFNLPFTTVGAGVSRSPSGKPMAGGA